jgi:uncharacterized protein (DUF362 family)
VNRREFLAGISSISFLLGVGVLRPSSLLAAPAKVDIALVKGGLPDGMFDLGIAALTGGEGMRAFIRPGQTVAVKPNVSWSAPPEQGATTDPRLVGRIIEHCLSAGARRVMVADHTISGADRAYQVSGIGAAVKMAGGQVVPANAQRYYQDVDIPGGRILTGTAVHELFLEADFIINVPVLKHHGSTGITAGLKNLMGLVWNRQTYHRIGLHQAIADFALRVTPQLTVIDAFRVMSSGGPRGSSSGASVREERVQILATDPVAADAAAALTWGTSPERIPHITMAADLGLGKADIEGLNIARIRA